MPITTLPVGIAAKLTQLQRRVVGARVLRGLLGLVAVSALAFSFIYLIDATIGLTTRGLQVAFVAWALASFSVAIFRIILPLCQRPDPLALAAIIEAHHPELQECLSSSVALSSHRDHANGADELVALLNRQAEEQCEDLDVRGVYSLKPPGRGWLVALAVSAVILGTTLAADRDQVFARRFLNAWFDPVIGYAGVVTPGDGLRPVDTPVAITTRLIQEETAINLPRACYLHYRLGDGPLQRQRMTGTEDNAYRATFDRLQGNLTYHVEAGEWRSDTYRLALFEPVQATEETVQVVPPPYVNPKVHPERQESTKPVAYRVEDEGYTAQPSSQSAQQALQYSRLRYAWRFNRAPVNLIAHWMNVDPRKPTEVELPLSWSPDHSEAQVEIPLTVAGTYLVRLTMVAEADFHTRSVGKPWHVIVDEPPVFVESVSGLPRRLSTEATLPQGKAGDLLRLRVAVEDAVGLDQLALEYRINEGRAATVALAPGNGQRAVAGEFPFRLPANLKDGDLVEFRLKATDNRRLAVGALENRNGVVVPVTALTPQATYEPALREGKDQWLAVKIAPQAESLPKQEIAGEQEDLDKSLVALKKKIQAEQALLKVVKLAAHAQNFLPAHALELLAKAQLTNRQVADDLMKLANQSAAKAPGLAELALQIADAEIARTENTLKEVEAKRRDPGPRDRLLDQADSDLAQALKKLDQLKELGQLAAQDRLDQQDLQRLADLQEELARRAEELAKRDLAKDAEARKELERLQEEQDRVADELAKLGKRSKLFQEAMQEQQKAEAMRLAQKANDLAKAQQAMAGQPEKGAKEKDLAPDSQELAEDLLKLSQKASDPKAMAGAKEAAHAAAEAKAAMDKGKKADTPAEAKELAKEAALKLEMAAKKADAAAQLMPGPMKKDADAAQTGQALEKAQDRVMQAKEDLKAKPPAKASPAMNLAAQAMQKAAKHASDQLAQSTRKTGPTGKQFNPRAANDATGASTSFLLGDLGKFAGKSWGELPGEVRNRIVQDLGVRYGDDFAGMVRRYFEQIADVPLNSKQ